MRFLFGGEDINCERVVHICVSSNLYSNGTRFSPWYIIRFNPNLVDHEIGTQTACKYRPFRFLFYGEVDHRHRHWLLRFVPLVLILSSFTRFSAVADTSKNREISLTPNVMYSGWCQCFLYLYALWHYMKMPWTRQSLNVGNPRSRQRPY